MCWIQLQITNHNDPSGDNSHFNLLAHHNRRPYRMMMTMIEKAIKYPLRELITNFIHLGGLHWGWSLPHFCPRGMHLIHICTNYSAPNPSTLKGHVICKCTPLSILDAGGLPPKGCRFVLSGNVYVQTPVEGGRRCPSKEQNNYITSQLS